MRPDSKPLPVRACMADCPDATCPARPQQPFLSRPVAAAQQRRLIAAHLSSGRRHGGTVRCLKGLLRQKLVHHEGTGVEGYRLTPLGYDYLALKALVQRGAVAAVGRQIGVGKESDVFEVGAVHCLAGQRLHEP